MAFTEISQNKKIPDTSCIKDLKEARAGFEPAVKVLQTSALPLGYDAILTFNTKSTKGLRFSAF